MKRTPKHTDALIGRRVLVKDTATVKPGEHGVIVRALANGEYEVDFGGEGSTFYYAMDEFIVLPEGGGIAEAGQQIEADPHLVAFSLTNPRKRKGLDIDSINALASNIKVHGLLQPIVVRPLPGARAADTFEGREEGQPLPTYELVCGERRLRACRIAGLASIPMLVRNLDDEAALQLQLVENIEREDLDPMEEAEGFELLRAKLGYSVEQIAERIGRGKGESYVYKTMKLLALTPESREAMYEGHLGRSTGLLVARYPTGQQPAVVEFIKSLAVNGEPAPFRTVEPKVFTRFNLGLKAAVFDIRDATLLADCGACTNCPKRTGASADLFNDGDQEDSCTDPDCFAAKREAHIELVKERARKEGLTVIEGDEARAAVPTPYALWRVGYERLENEAYTETGNDGVEREVTFGDALKKLGKKAPKPMILINPHTGAAEEVISEELADKLVDQFAPAEDAGTERPAKSSSSAREDNRPEDVRALDSHDVHRAVMLRLFDAIRSRERTEQDMLLIAGMFSLLVWEDDPDSSPLLEYLGWSPDLEEIGYDEIHTAILERLKALPVADVAAATTMLAVECAFFRQDRAGEVAIAQSYGVDVLAVRDKVAEDLERQQADSQEEDPEEDEAEA
jgi:ParB/RepB/Spo0J family partition protein